MARKSTTTVDGLKATKLDDDVIAVLRDATIEGTILRLPPTQLDRKLYLRVDEALQALGGKWSRGKKAHVFDGDPRTALDKVLSDGAVTTDKDLEFFETPSHLAKQLVQRANVKFGMLALEPSAGRGSIASAMRHIGASVVCMEIDPGRVSALSRSGHSVFCVDFLSVDPSILDLPDLADRVVMNPPFSRMQDAKHVLHALRFMKADGKLVSVMSAGILTNQSKAAAAFRDFVAQEGGIFERLPSGSFAESGTQVETVVLEMGRHFDDEELDRVTKEVFR